MIVKGIHYGLTLLYSFLLPLFYVEETSEGFVFKVSHGRYSGLECSFREESLETTCRTPSGADPALLSLLGVDKRGVFKEIGRLTGSEKPVSSTVSLLYSPSYKLLVAYSAFLSRNTDYYINTVKWVREALEGSLFSNSYIVREFVEVSGEMKRAVGGDKPPVEEALKLMSARGIGPKTAQAYLLHAHGLTRYAPVDRHYARFLGVPMKQPPKRRCLKQRLDCGNCGSGCVYSIAHNLLGWLNGAVQSLVYIEGRLLSKRRAWLEEVLVKEPEYFAERLGKELESVRRLVHRHLRSNEPLFQY